MPVWSSFTSTVAYSTTDGWGETSGKAWKVSHESTPDGTTVQRIKQNYGERPVTETHHYDHHGQWIASSHGGGDDGGYSTRRIEDVTHEEDQRERDARRREKERDREQQGQKRLADREYRESNDYAKRQPST